MLANLVKLNNKKSKSSNLNYTKSKSLKFITNILHQLKKKEHSKQRVQLNFESFILDYCLFYFV